MPVRRLVVVLLTCALFSGCVGLPHGPNVTVLPGRHGQAKSLDVFHRDDVYCRQYAKTQIGESPEDAAAKSTAKSGVLTALAGAAAGALIGVATGAPGEGAAIGAGTGGLVGLLGGSAAGHQAAQTLQQRYDVAYIQCHYSQGNSIPSMPTMSR